MKYPHLLVALVSFSCSQSDQAKPGNETEFVAAARRLHDLYINAGSCEERNAMVDPSPGNDNWECESIRRNTILKKKTS